MAGEAKKTPNQVRPKANPRRRRRTVLEDGPRSGEAVSREARGLDAGDGRACGGQYLARHARGSDRPDESFSMKPMMSRRSSVS